MMARAQKGKKAANKEKQKVARIALQQSWNHSIKRVQRYLGIREAGHEKQMQAIRSGLQNAGLVWKDYDAAVQAAAAKLRPATDFNTDRLASYAQEGSVVFVCIDVSHTSTAPDSADTDSMFRLKPMSEMLVKLLRLVLQLLIQEIFRN